MAKANLRHFDYAKMAKIDADMFAYQTRIR